MCRRNRLCRVCAFKLEAGGIGYAELGHEQHGEILKDVLEAVVECPCVAGCPSCVLPGASRIESSLESEVMEYPYPKEATRWVAGLRDDPANLPRARRFTENS